MTSRRELIAAISQRYHSASRADKEKILDEFTEVTGFHRKHAIRARRGKGSHGTLFYGESFTIVQNLKRELPRGTLREMLRQIGLSPNDLL